MQITAQLDDSYAEKFDQLLHIKGLNQVQQLKEALGNYFAQELAAAQIQRQKQVWLDSGFIGCAEGSEDGSVNYKKYIGEYLDEKYPQH